MTLSPELLAMVADVPAATDEEIAGMLETCQRYRPEDVEWTFTDVFALISRIVAERKVVKPLEWSREAPYHVARNRQGMHYSIERMDDDGEIKVFYLRSPFLLNASKGVFSSLEAAKTAAQADYEQRIRAALSALEERG